MKVRSGRAHLHEGEIWLGPQGAHLHEGESCLGLGSWVPSCDKVHTVLLRLSNFRGCTSVFEVQNHVHINKIPSEELTS